MLLKYLFLSEHEDGTFIRQDQSDESQLAIGKSRFFDVLNAKSRCVRFILYGGDSGAVGIDLKTGEFAVNGTIVRLHTDQDLPLENLELIYWRVRTQHAKITPQMTEGNVTGLKVEGLPESPIIFQIGFSATGRDGKPFRRVMEVF